MNVGQLKKIIAKLDDGTEVLTGGPDHSYRRVRRGRGVLREGRVQRDRRLRDKREGVDT